MHCSLKPDLRRFGCYFKDPTAPSNWVPRNRAGFWKLFAAADEQIGPNEDPRFSKGALLQPTGPGRGPILKSFRGKEASGMVAQQRLKSTARQAGHAARWSLGVTQRIIIGGVRMVIATPAGDHWVYLRAAVGPQKCPIAPWISSACDFILER
jgi:hypothetical protein